MQGLNISEGMCGVGTWALARYDWSQGCTWLYTEIAASLWKTSKKSPADEPHLSISTTFTWKENSLVSSRLMKHWSTRAEHPEQAAGAVALTERALECPRFRGKGGNKNLGNKAWCQVEGRRGDVLAFRGRSAADLKARRSRAQAEGRGAAGLRGAARSHQCRNRHRGQGPCSASAAVCLRACISKPTKLSRSAIEPPAGAALG